MTNLKIVTKERETEYTFKDLDLAPDATDSEIVRAAERRLDQNLNGFIVTKEGENALVSPAPVFG